MPKGGNTENEFCWKFSLLWSNGRTKKLCRRNREYVDEKHQGGDLTYRGLEIKPLFDAWNIEVKSGYARKGKKPWDILDILDSQQGIPTLFAFWEQCKKDADLTNREPVLCFRRNNRQACIMFRSEYLSKMRDFFGDFQGDKIRLIQKIGEDVIVLKFDEFQDWVSDRFAIFFGADRKKYGKRLIDLL